MADNHDEPPYTIPADDSAQQRRARSRGSQTAAVLLHLLPAKASPADRLPDALRPVLKLERSETELMIAMRQHWRQFLQTVYVTGPPMRARG
jgi:hypothetical protein